MRTSPTFPKLKWPFDAEQFAALQKWIDQMRDVFANGISFGENMACDVVTFDFVAGATPSKRIASARRPAGVVPFSIQQIQPTSNTPPVVADSFSWTFADGSLSFPAYGTIAGSATYRATVLVVRS